MYLFMLGKLISAHLFLSMYTLLLTILGISILIQMYIDEKIYFRKEKNMKN